MKPFSTALGISTLALVTTLALGEVILRFLRPKLQPRDIAVAA